MFKEIATKRNLGFGGIGISLILAVLGSVLILKLMIAKVPITTFVDSSIQEFSMGVLPKDDATTIELNDVSAILVAKKDGSVQLLTSNPVITHSQLSIEERLLQIASSSSEVQASHMRCTSSQREYCFTGMYNGYYYSNACWCG